MFDIRDDDEHVPQLKPYLGAFGHLVALRDDDLAYLHIHPEETDPESGRVEFSAQFPTPGRYRLFLQAKPDGNLITTSFDIWIDRWKYLTGILTLSVNSLGLDLKDTAVVSGHRGEVTFDFVVDTPRRLLVHWHTRYRLEAGMSHMIRYRSDEERVSPPVAPPPVQTLPADSES